MKNNIKFLIPNSAFLILVACTTIPKTVEVPIAVECPQPPEITRPQLAVKTLQPASPPAEVIKAYAMTLEQLAGYATELETILKGYRK